MSLLAIAVYAVACGAAGAALISSAFHMGGWASVVACAALALAVGVVLVAAMGIVAVSDARDRADGER